MRSARAIVSLCAVAAVLATALLLAPDLAGQEKEDPILATVKATIKDPSKPFTMLVRVQVKEDAGAKFEAAFARATRATRKEKGNRAYDLNRDLKMPTRYVVYERWQNLKALQEHLQSEHIKTLLSEIGDLLAAPPEVSVMTPF
jgi:quinol monooxygenase YgiN